MTNTWNLDADLQSKFLAACQEAATNDEAFAKFKENPYIGVVIENSTQEWADKIPTQFHGSTPTETRYNYTAHLIYRMCGIKINEQIVEIGGGYGGLASIILSALGGFTSYVIFDLPEVQSLQERYINNNRAIFPRKMRLDNDRSISLCIAWCSWAELSLEARKEYLEKVISKSEHIFFCVNWDYEENKAMLLEYFPDLKEYNDEHVNNIIYT